MIDIHAHALPLVDDGAPNNQLALKMIEQAKNQGVTTMILTPHYRYEDKKSKEQLKSAFVDFCALTAGLGVDLFLGQEIFVEEDSKARLENGELLTLAGSKYVLLEFNSFEEIDVPEIVYNFITAGFKPIVAHAERYFYFTVSDALEVKGLGGYIQINARSIVDECVGSVRRRARKLLKNGVVDFVASDVHHNRVNYMLKAYNIIKKRYGEEIAEQLFTLNALEIIKGQA